MASAQSQFVAEFIRRAAAVVKENREYLIDLDRAIGDADHGENMDRGFAAVTEKVPCGPETTVADALKGVATTLMSVVGGAAGPLYGTAFLRASKAVTAEGTADEAAASIEAALGGLQARGKANEGEATMIDAWAPAARAAREAADSGASVPAVLRAAADAAAAGAVATEPMLATKGRASYLGERSIGHRDPGAQSTALLLGAAADAAAEVCGGDA